MKREKIAIVGAGIAGLGAAYFLYKKYDITLFEKNDYAGGHSNTVIVKEGNKEIPIDTAVMVYNEKNYPYFTRLINTLHIPTTWSTCTISFNDLLTGLEYALPHLGLLFAQPKNLFNRSFLSLMKEIIRFGKESPEVLIDPHFANYSVAQYAEEKKFSDNFLHKYFLPLTASLWQAHTDPKLINNFPIVTVVRYFNNHGLLSPSFSLIPTRKYDWRTFLGGTKVYRDKMLALFPNALNLNTPVKSVKRVQNHVEVTTKNGEKLLFDRVVFACHADEALALLSDATKLEKELLGPFYYQTNTVTLHTDASMMPRTKAVWSAFNCRFGEKKALVEQTYYVNYLQRIPTKKDYFLAIGNDDAVDPKKIIKKVTFSHAVYNMKAAAAQKRLQELNENGRTYFCGSYFRYAFHEDAFVSALEVARKITGQMLWE